LTNLPIPSAHAPALSGAKDQPALVANQLTKRFGERTAFSEVSFDVAYGEVFGFLGPNGAGKTTTVRTLGTLIAPTSGSATVAGIPLSAENGVEIRERISIMPEAPGLAPALWQGPHVLAEILFAPLLAGWSIWVGIGISARSSDVRVAQQLGTLASLPPLGVVALVSFNVFTPSVKLAVMFALVLLAADVVLWRAVSAMFDRERLITGAKAQEPIGAS
jgi:hypothetical protein